MPTLRVAPCILALFFVPENAGAQQDLPILEAHSRSVDIRDGVHLWKGIWSIDPTLPIDTYYARRSGAPRTVTFISDAGSRSFQVEPGKEYDLVLLLDGKDACHTRISTMRLPYRRAPTSSGTSPDTIPFRLVNGRIHVEASVNGSPPLDLMFDTGADNLVLHPSALAKGVALEFDGSMLNAGLGGTLTRRTSSRNHLEIAGLAWEPELVLFIENQSSDCDGILGYVAFEDKALEIDYEHSSMRVHDAAPPGAAGFARFPFRYEGTLLAMETGFGTGTTTGRGWFVIDTGATAALHLNQAFAGEQGLYDLLERIGTSTSRGVGPGVLENQIVRLPELRFGDYLLENVPTHLETPGQEKDFSTGCWLGMDVLGRFDTILDFQHDEIDLRPNAHFHDSFPVRSGPSTTVLVLGVGVLSIGSFLVASWYRVKRRSASVEHHPPSPSHSMPH